LASEAIFGKPLVTNVYRSVIVEAIVAAALPTWKWCSSDYAGHDFERGSIKLEVKQSALLQTWSKSRLSKASWDIAPRTGFWVDGDTWVPSPGRNAHMYVLSLHTIADENADHRDPLQWQFYVIASRNLPDVKTIGVRAAEKLIAPVKLDRLNERVEEIVCTIE
jgi:hypothetical protein